MTSPLLRCQETAAASAAAWNVGAAIEPGVAEIPSPEGVAMADRVEWLRVAMAGTWAALGRAVHRVPRRRGGDACVALPDDTVVTSHFIAINAVIGAALGDDRLVIRSLDNCSVTVVDVDRRSAAPGRGWPRSRHPDPLNDCAAGRLRR